MKTTIFDADNWREVGATLGKNKTRTFLTAFGIFWGTLMLALLWGGAEGMKGMMRRNFEGFASNTAVMNTRQRTLSYKGFNKGSSWELTMTDINNMNRTIPGLEVAVPMNVRNFVTASYGTKTTSTTIRGEGVRYSEIFLPTIYDGRYLNESDERHERKVCVIGKRVAESLFGAESPIGKYVSVGGIFYKIIGVAGQTNRLNVGGKVDESIIIPSSTMRRAFNLGEEVDGVFLLFKNGYSPSTALPRIERLVFKQHIISPDDHNALMFFDIAQAFEMVDNVFKGISLLVLFVGCGSLIAGIIGVGNIMWVIVKERTQEFGIRRAIGATPMDITIQILSEGAVMTLIAGMAGIVAATGILGLAQKIIAMNTQYTPPFQLDFTAAMTIVTVFIVLGMLAGLMPARKAMKIKPIEAMRDK